MLGSLLLKGMMRAYASNFWHHRRNGWFWRGDCDDGRGVLLRSCEDGGDVKNERGEEGEGVHGCH